jgi:hypothetical protein
VDTQVRLELGKDRVIEDKNKTSIKNILTDNKMEEFR